MNVSLYRKAELANEDQTVRVDDEGGLPSGAVASDGQRIL